MWVAITRVSTVSDDAKTCPYDGAVWIQDSHEWQVRITSLDEIMDRVGEIIVDKRQLSSGISYNVTIYDERF